ncbi:MAG: flagellar basal-body rod protein FlgG [Planctomycetia bacterium]|nr:flagellar basal-body rod protein FlgG [Planctomycetia bacterium]
MSIQTLYTAATGMDALQTKLDVIANNLANVNTTAFKRDRANFEDLFYIHEKLPGSQDAGGNLAPEGIHVGLGSRVQSVQSDFRQGSFDPTNGPLDLAIEGEGFFQVVDPGTGEILYTRAGNFTRNVAGQVVLASAGIGRILEPPFSLTEDVTDVVISPDGRVDVRLAGNPALSNAGQIQLSRFINPEGLIKIGENLYAASDASGPATPGLPGQSGYGHVRQRTLELSNVEPVKELIDLITTQRAFELNSEAIHAGDQILQLIANLRRF